MTLIENAGTNYEALIRDGVLQTRIAGAAAWTAHAQMVNIVAANYVRPWIIGRLPDGTYRGTRIDDLATFQVAQEWDYLGTTVGITPIPLDIESTTTPPTSPNPTPTTTSPLFAEVLVDRWDYTRLQDTIDPVTGSAISRRAQHVIIFDPSTGSPVIPGSGGSTTTLQPTTIGGNNISLTTTASPLSGNSTIVKSALIQSIRSDGTSNTGMVWIGSQAGQFYVLKPGDYFMFEASSGRTLNLNQIYVRSNVAGTQINFIVMD